MEKGTYNKAYVLGITLVSAMGGLLFGYDWVVIGGAKPLYELYFGISGIPAMQGWAMSCALVGCIIGSMLSGMMSDRFGRKSLLTFSALLFVITSIGTGLSSSFIEFVLFRISGGVAIGLASNLSPVYIAEVSPAESRGKFVSLNQLTIVIGILAAQIVNRLIAQPIAKDSTAVEILNSWNGQMGWRWMFIACSVPAFLFFTFMFFVPESPRYLIKKGIASKAQKVLARIGGEAYAANEIILIKDTVQSETGKIDLSGFRQKGMKKIIILGIFIAVFQQWCGINVIFNYAQEIFSAAGYGVSDILFNIVISGSINLIFTFVAINTVDRFGRKPLMLIGAGGLAGIFTILGTLYFMHVKGIVMLVLVMTAIACYSMSLAPITWVVLSEIFPNKIRGAAMAIATFSLWAACFILTYTFPLFNSTLGAAGTFWIYAFISVIGFIFIKFRLPETKGKSLEQLESLLLNK